ncbi:hypothetical protein FPHYL_4130 [Fusarium phyllophilum]|uniref:Apple domain-containing protein n=1 Tax=Fusarium phyllophilum TaxID=47803 RepID=A0A8H5K2T5_9HYPO|nr:hypothetical protein FPHYL_4130 [Fusarium phyllophilum]
MRFLAFLSVCLPLISGSPVDTSRSDLSPRVVTSTEQPSCGVVGHKPDPMLTRSRKCRLVDCRELCSVVTGCQSYAESSARCLLFSPPVSEGFQQDPTSLYTLYDLDCSMPMYSTTETLPESTNGATTGLSTSGTEVAATSNAQPSSTAATFATELSTDLASASTSMFREMQEPRQQVNLLLAASTFSQHWRMELLNSNTISQWNVDPDNLEVTASWINTDGSTPPITLFVSESSNWIGMTGSMSAVQAAFQNQRYRRIKLVLELIS